MPRWPTVTDRLGRLGAVGLALVAVTALITAWTVAHASTVRRAADARPVPTSLLHPVAPGADVTAAPVGFPWQAPAPSTASDPAGTGPVAHELVDPIRPTHLFVPAIGVNTTVTPKPTQHTLDPFVGKVVPSFGVPADLYSTTWWSSGPRPGAPGMAVVLGHTQVGGYGVFNRLGRLRPHEVIGITDGATVLRFAVMAVHSGIPKTDPTALSTTLQHHPAGARLALLTCSGRFDQGYRESSENTVVFASLVSAG